MQTWPSPPAVCIPEECGLPKSGKNILKWMSVPLLAFLEPVFPTSFFLTIIQMKSQGK